MLFVYCITLTFVNFIFRYAILYYKILNRYKGQYTHDVHKNCLIFKTPYPLSIYVQNISTPLTSDVQF